MIILLIINYLKDIELNYTKDIAEYVVNLKYDDLPEEVVNQTKMLFLHVIGVSLAAVPHSMGKDAINLAKNYVGEKGECTILGEKQKVSCK